MVDIQNWGHKVSAWCCNELTSPPTQVVLGDHLSHHKWSPRIYVVPLRVEISSQSAHN